MIGAVMAKRAIHSAFAALNRRDIPAFLSRWSDDATFVFPGDVSASGEHHGRVAIQAWIERFLEQFPKLEFTLKAVCVDNLFALGGTNEVAAHWEIELKNRQGREGRNSGVTVITLRGGKVTHVRDYIFDLGPEFRANWGEAGAVAGNG